MVATAAHPTDRAPHQLENLAVVHQQGTEFGARNAINNQAAGDHLKAITAVPHNENAQLAGKGYFPHDNEVFKGMDQPGHEASNDKTPTAAPPPDKAPEFKSETQYQTHDVHGASTVGTDRKVATAQTTNTTTDFDTVDSRPNFAANDKTPPAPTSHPAEQQPDLHKVQPHVDMV